MAILDGNTRKISGTTIGISNLFIMCDQPQAHVVSPETIELTLPYVCYESSEKWLENPSQNKLKIDGFFKRNVKVTYNRSTDGDIFEFIDVKIKEDILILFPESNADLITFQPPHAE